MTVKQTYDLLKSHYVPLKQRGCNNCVYSDNDISVPVKQDDPKNPVCYECKMSFYVTYKRNYTCIATHPGSRWKWDGKETF